MYEFDWANKDLWTAEAPAKPFESSLSRERVSSTLLVHWEEHCIECAPPQCYSTCPLYVRRDDARCARFVYGIYPTRNLAGLLDRGADVRFRRWGKIETKLYGKSVSMRRHRLLDRVDAAATPLLLGLSRALRPLTGRARFTSAWAKLREGLLVRASRPGERYDDFVLECYAPDREPFRLILEYVNGDEVLLRHSFDIEPGHNFHRLPADAFGPARSGRLRLYPENDAERRVIFTWLDFVSYGVAGTPAPKVKVVAWDLDETLWRGTLLDGDTGVVRDEARAVVEALDARGILQTIVSKNSHEQAWPLVEATGLQDYFLAPAINWGQKSESLRQIAKQLNLGLDSFAVIDDSSFERAEIRSALPMVRAYSPDDLPKLLTLPEFDVPVTEMSARRRLSYIAGAARERVREEFRGDYEEFLRSCNLRVAIFRPREEAHVQRCLELVQRSNQLNLSARRYSEEEFDAVLGEPGLLSLAMHAEDRFGDYGIIGFAVVDERVDPPVLRDYVLSCRIAGKRAEQTFVQWLAAHEHARGARALQVKLTRTERNGPLISVLDEFPLEQLESHDHTQLLEMQITRPEIDDVVEIHAEL